MSSDQDRPRVVVVGAGIGGLALAVALASTGTPATLYEQALVLGEVGAGVQLAPNATRRLALLGLQPALDRCGVRMEAMEFRRWDGALVSRTPLGRECERRFGAAYYGIQRAHLQAALLAVRPAPVLHLGRSLVALSQTADQVRLTFADRRPSATGRRPGSDVVAADAVAGADGIHSVVRTALVADAPAPAGLGVFRGLVPADRLPSAAREPVVRMWMGPGRHFVCYPVAGGDLVSFAATTPATGPARESWAERGSPDDVVAAFAGWPDLVRQVTGAATQVGRWALHDRPPLTGWRAGRVTVLGDAAHPMLPFMAQGANQAVEDAVELARVLAGTTRRDVPAALAAYARNRAPRTAAIQAGSRQNAAALHLPDGSAQLGRDRAMALASGLDRRAPLFGH